ncbi:Fic family protein [Candidatus Woesearchaeota archaeon]|nr:Fic family protein [Candidatus Woesearchaeota archaeon]
MEIVNKKGFLYLSYSFRKEGKVVNRKKYLGKTISADVELIKEVFLRQCLQESVFKKINLIKKNFGKEWNRYPETIKKKILLDLSIDFTYNTNAIEGSTITLEETDDILKRKIAPNKPIRDIQETINHSKTFLKVINEKSTLNLSTILSWHKEIFEQTKTDIAGVLRDYLVRVGNYLAPDWQDLKNLMKKFFDWYEKNRKIMNPIELAARAHYKFEKIHPFGDGNGRIGRLIIAYILIKNNFPLLIIEYKKRKSYYHALNKTENDFLNYFIRRYLAVHKKYLSC